MGLDKWYKDVKSNNFLFEVGSGRVGTAFGIFKFGENNAIPVAGATIWDADPLTGGNPYLPYLATI